MANLSDLSGPLYDFSVLRVLRKRKGLTLEKVAEHSGVSPAVISKLERNQSSAELETLYRLGRAFEMSASELLALAEARMAYQTKATAYDHDGFHFKRITYNNISCFYGRARKGAKVSRPEIHHNDYEVCWVLTGSVILNLPSECRKIRAGEAVQFDAILEHTYEAAKDTEIIIMHIRKDNRF